MPRRPRPAPRRPPQHATLIVQQKNALATPSAKTAGVNRNPQLQQQEVDSEVEASSQPGSGGFFEDSNEEESDAGPSGSEAAADDVLAGAEPDVARVAQWMDEDELDDLSGEESESGDDEEVDDARLEADLQSLSFGALRKAQKALAKAQAVRDSENESSEDDPEYEEESYPPISKMDKGKGRDELSREKKEVQKRTNKHAPMEMSSKRPVSRSRFVTGEKTVSRDPRFLPITGEFDAKRFQTQYGFLSDLHQQELKTLKENLQRARKLLTNSPRDLREEREAEVERLERAVKRAESTVNKDRREKVEIEALSKAVKEERERQKQGKKAWFMKDADKKELLLRAKYEALASAGGKGAVRKAIEKKQKKVSQKEKKKRPGSRLHARSIGEGGPSRKRPHSGGEGDSMRKRPRA